MDDGAACFVGPPPDEEEFAFLPSQALQTPRVVQPLTSMEQLTADLNLVTWSSSPPTFPVAANEAAVHELDKSATSAPERRQASTSWLNDAVRCEATTHHFVGPSHAANRRDGGWRNDAARRELTSWKNDVADGALVAYRDFVNCGPYHAYNRHDASGAKNVRMMATRMPVPLTSSDEDDEEEKSDGMPDLVESSESD